MMGNDVASIVFELKENAKVFFLGSAEDADTPQREGEAHDQI